MICTCNVWAVAQLCNRSRSPMQTSSGAPSSLINNAINGFSSLCLPPSDFLQVWQGGCLPHQSASGRMREQSCSTQHSAQEGGRNGHLHGGGCSQPPPEALHSQAIMQPQHAAQRQPQSPVGDQIQDRRQQLPPGSPHHTCTWPYWSKSCCAALTHPICDSPGQTHCCHEKHCSCQVRMGSAPHQ